MSDGALYALGAIGSAAINSAGNKKSQKRAFKYTRELNQMAYAFQREMWNATNAYNLPINEINRLVQAGINPAVAFSNAGAAAAPVPNASSGGSVGALPLDTPNLGGAVAAAQNATRLDNETAVAESVVDRNSAEAEKLRTEAGESVSRTNLNENEYKIRSSPEYIQALSEAPGLANDIRRLDRDMKSLDYSFELYNYGNRIESADLSLDQQKLNYLTSGQNLLNLQRDYDRIGAHIRYLDAGTVVQREQAAVLRQDLDIRAGKALLGTLEYEALRYCQEHGINDSVTGEIRGLIPALADEYSAKVSDGTYSSRSSAVVAQQDLEYQSEHGQERRAYETELVRRQGNYLRTSQWNMSINTGLNFVKTAVDAGSAIMTRGVSKAAGSLVTPNSGHTNFPISPEARSVLEKVLSKVESRMQY